MIRKAFGLTALGFAVAACSNAPTEAPANLAGDWVATGYWCESDIPEEKLTITIKGDVVTATKITGDNCVPANTVSWTGTYSDGQIPVKFTVSNGPGAPLSEIDEVMTINADGTITGYGTTLTRAE